MNEKEELKSMIWSFRVSELQSLLAFSSRIKHGKKVELRDRAEELLKLESPTIASKIRALFKNITSSASEVSDMEPSTADSGYDKHVTSTIPHSANPYMGYSLRDFGSYAPPFHNYYSINGNKHDNPYTGNVYHNPYQSTSKTSALHYPIHPDVRLKALPFYEIKAELLKPSSLVPQGSQRLQDSSFIFHLTPYQARDIRAGKSDFTTQVLVRFCLLETTSEQEDCFPAGVILKVNGKVCALPPPIPTNKAGVEPKRPPLPVNVTQHVKPSSTVGNTIQVYWNTEYARMFVVTAYLVEKKTSENLLSKLKAKGVRGADYTRGMIKDKLSDDADSEIATTSLRVSLSCPLGKMRMITPCRASTCDHLQCFDASLFLLMNEKKSSWMCPVCDKPAIYRTLVIDGYFLDVINSSRLPSHVQEIQLHKDGSWSTLPIKKENVPPVEQGESSKTKIECEDIDIVDDDDHPPSATSKDTKKSSDVVVDLTFSDSSDDDEPLSKRLRIENPPEANESSVSSDTRTNRSPSLIILDDESPPVTPLISHVDLPMFSSSTYPNPQSRFFDLNLDDCFNDPM